MGGYQLGMEPLLAALDTSGDASNVVWLVVGVLAIIALLLFILGRR